jgi:hypothetical protein
MQVEQIEKELRAITIYDLIAVTLTDSDVLLGGISKHWEWDGNVIAIAFNTVEGQRSGRSHQIEVPIESVADVSVVPLADSSTPRLPADDPQVKFLREVLGEDASIDPRILPQDYPNPLASVICIHNTEVASSHNLVVGGWIEKALPLDAISPEGIRFEDDLLLFADWEFFDQQTSGPLSVTGGLLGVIELSKEMSRSPQRQVVQRLKEQALTERVRKRVLPTSGECIVHGRIRVGESPDTTQIEGQECHLWMVAGASGESCPVLVKVRMLRYPLEFIKHVDSELAFYGELLPIPLKVTGEVYQKALLARAIAHFHVSAGEKPHTEDMSWQRRAIHLTSRRLACIRLACSRSLRSLWAQLRQFVSTVDRLR